MKNQIRFSNETGFLKVSMAAAVVSELLTEKSPLIQEVKFKKFKYGSGTGYSVAENLLSLSGLVDIKLYYPRYKNSNAIGHFSEGNIFLNAYRAEGLMMNDLIGFILHELAHKLGYHHKSWIWFLNNRKTKDKCEFSVPYFLSENVERWV